MHTTNETTPRPHGMSGQILTLLRAAYAGARNVAIEAKGAAE
jgi:hypothetical protein